MSLLFSTVCKPIEEHLCTTLDHTEGVPYDRKAQAYERLVQSRIYNKLVWGTSPGDYTQFAQLVVQQTQGTLLDIGCGGLVQTAQVYAEANHPVMLLDHSLAMLRIGKQRLIDCCGQVPEHIRLVQADAFRLPFETHSLDSVCSFGILHLFENKAAFLKEALRVLKPGHRFYFTSMTADRWAGRLYMQLLKHEFAPPLTSVQILDLFEPAQTKIDSYKKGAMLFISGVKI